jgi:hypothetical protein
MENKIDCDVNCPIFIKVLNSCPSKNIEIFGFTNDDLFEMAMVVLSTSPYILSFMFLLSTMYYRTTRSVIIIMMIFIQVLFKKEIITLEFHD